MERYPTFSQGLCPAWTNPTDTREATRYKGRLIAKTTLQYVQYVQMITTVTLSWTQREAAIKRE